MDEIKGSSVLIMGFGIEGQSVLRFLQKNYSRLKIGIADKKKKPITDITIHTHFGDSYLKAITEYDTIVRSPGIPVSLLRTHGATHITSAYNIFSSQLIGRVIGITGTKGKSTTASLIRELLKTTLPDVRLVGNIGYPFLDHSEDQTKDTWFVAELSSHQLEDARFSPHIAVLLDITPEHLDYYEDFDAYKSAKQHILDFQTFENWLVVNPNHTELSSMIKTSKGRKVHFGVGTDSRFTVIYKNGGFYVKTDHGLKKVIAGDQTHLLGAGNTENMLAALSAAHIVGVPIEKMREALLHFRPLPHRLEKIGTYKGITFYNDSLSTVPEAVMHALDALGDQVTSLIVGGYDRGVSMEKLGQFLRNKKSLSHLILFPDTGDIIWNEIKGSGPTHLIAHPVTSMESAIDIAYQVTPQGKICLLSPGAASFNLFKDYKERGESFIYHIKTHAKEKD